MHTALQGDGTYRITATAAEIDALSSAVSLAHGEFCISRDRCTCGELIDGLEPCVNPLINSAHDLLNAIANKLDAFVSMHRCTVRNDVGHQCMLAAVHTERTGHQFPRI